MSSAPLFHNRLERIYARALLFYPARFRSCYGTQMLQALRDAQVDPTLSRRSLVLSTLNDLAISLVKENLAMLRDTFTRPVLIFNSLVLAGIATVLGFALYAIPQQVLRLGANDPQLQLATDAVASLENGKAASEAIPTADIDMARSLTPFVIAYDDAGKPMASQATLNGAVPAPPTGVFDYVRQHSEERLSWQPVMGREHGVRIAAVVERVGGAHPGFVLAGRSLREVEAREQQIEHMAGLAWIAMLGLIVVGTAAFGWFTREAASTQQLVH